MIKELFQDRKLIIATKHQKEEVILPLLEKELGVDCSVDKMLDTDSLGTFTGEIVRELDPIANAKKKCLLAMELNQCDLGIANEGSFGAHPSLFFVPADEEIMVLIDQKNQLEITVKLLSTETNFNAKEVSNETELLDFVKSVGFPSHKVILRTAEGDTSNVIKDLESERELKKTFNRLKKLNETVFVETDMRAMNNPKRMKVIQQATQKLIEKIKSLCPTCSMPGFGITEVISGLKCMDCGTPTRSTLLHIYQCQHCSHRMEKEFPHGKTEEDPMYCDYCNP